MPIPPKISVIIPCYKQAHFLAEALTCLQAQSFQEWECLIIDDGSPDNTAEIGVEWAARDPRVRYVFQKNGGRSNARNHGLREARGEFIQFLDADDLIEPSKFASQLEFLRDHPEIGIVCSDLRYFPETSPEERQFAIFGPNVPWVEEAFNDARPMLHKLLERNIIGINSALVRREVFDEVGYFDESLNTMEDWHFWTRCAASGVRFHFHDVCGSTALVRIHPESVSQNRAEMDDGTFRMMLGIAKFLNDSEARMKNFEIGLYRDLGKDRLVRIGRLGWANRYPGILRFYLRYLLGRHPRVSRFLTWKNFIG